MMRGFQLALLAGAIWEILSGLVLEFGYSASTASAHSTDAALHQGLWRPVQAIHYWNSTLLIVACALFLVIAIWTGHYNKPNRLSFYAALGVFLSALGGQLTGNLLPFDRHGVQTANVETGIAARAPGVGAFLREQFLGGPGFGPATLARWNALHWVFGILLVLAVLGTGVAHVRRGIASRRWAVVLGAIGPSILLGLIVPSPLGSPAGPADFSAYGAQVSWYTWPLHGSLVMFDRIHTGAGWIGAFLVPGLLVLAVVLLPILAGRIPLWIPRCGILVTCAFYLVAGLGFGGSFAPLIGTRDPPAPIVATQTQAQAGPIDRALAALGAKDFAAEGCSNCHGQNGDSGGVGPSLKSVGTLHPDANFFMSYVKSPTSLDPQSTMPAFPNLKQQELREIAEFLRAKRG